MHPTSLGKEHTFVGTSRGQPLAALYKKKTPPHLQYLSTYLSQIALFKTIPPARAEAARL